MERRRPPWPAICRCITRSSKFRYILVDAFQDISHARARLVLALRDQVPDCHLFCVGDDWQSIYRFAGSDVSLMTRFSHHFGFTRTTMLDDTYRFNNRISATSSRFVLKNPAQIPKSLRTHRMVSAPAVFVHFVQGREQALPSILAEIEAGTPGGTATCDACGHQIRMCPRCGLGRPVLRSSRFGRCLACTMYRSESSPCKYTQNLP